MAIPRAWRAFDFSSWSVGENPWSIGITSRCGQRLQRSSTAISLASSLNRAVAIGMAVVTVALDRRGDPPFEQHGGAGAAMFDPRRVGDFQLASSGAHAQAIRKTLQDRATTR